MPLSCPPDWVDSDAINLALSRLPSRLEREYQGKLERLEFGTILELALIGRLLQKGGPFAVSPWPEQSRVDAHLTMEDRTLELEIKSSIETRYEKNVSKMCQCVGEQVEKRWPGFKGEINLFNDFREIEVGNSRTLDIDGTAADVMRELEKAITPEGEVSPRYRDFMPGRLVTRIDPSSHLQVWHSSSRLPGGHEEDVIRRTLARALDNDDQFSRRYPAVLAVIQARMPDARIVHRGEPSVADESFAKHAHLSAIVAIPCPSVNGHPVVSVPDPNDTPARTRPLLGEEPQALADFLAVRLQVGPVWELLEKKVREEVELRKLERGEDV